MSFAAEREGQGPGNPCACLKQPNPSQNVDKNCQVLRLRAVYIAFRALRAGSRAEVVIENKQLRGLRRVTFGAAVWR
jgi:hypothetical protein